MRTTAGKMSSSAVSENEVDENGLLPGDDGFGEIQPAKLKYIPYHGRVARGWERIEETRQVIAEVLGKPYQPIVPVESEEEKQKHRRLREQHLDRMRNDTEYRKQHERMEEDIRRQNEEERRLEHTPDGDDPENVLRRREMTGED